MDGPMTETTSREGANPRRGRGPKQPPSDMEIIARAVGAMMVDTMITLLALSPEKRSTMDAITEITTVDGHSWLIRLEYLGFEVPRGPFASNASLPMCEHQSQPGPCSVCGDMG